jgi:hypothetical protein
MIADAVFKNHAADDATVKKLLCRDRVTKEFFRRIEIVPLGLGRACVNPERAAVVCFPTAILNILRPGHDQPCPRLSD